MKTIVLAQIICQAWEIRLIYILIHEMFCHSQNAQCYESYRRELLSKLIKTLTGKQPTRLHLRLKVILDWQMSS